MQEAQTSEDVMQAVRSSDALVSQVRRETHNLAVTYSSSKLSLMLS